MCRANGFLQAACHKAKRSKSFPIQYFPMDIDIEALTQ